MITEKEFLNYKYPKWSELEARSFTKAEIENLLLLWGQAKLHTNNGSVLWSDLSKILMSSEIWAESICTKLRATTDELRLHIDKFAKDAFNKGEERKGIKEWKYHFVSWCRYNPVEKFTGQTSSHSGLTAN